MTRKRKKKLSSRKSGRKPKVSSAYTLARLHDEMIVNFERKRYEQALSAARKLIQVAPRRSDERFDAFSIAGVCLMELRRFDEAYEVLSKAVKAFPDDSALRSNLAGAALFTSRMGMALQELRVAAELEPKGTRLRKIIDRQMRDIEPLVMAEIQDRGPDFTLEQLIEQQELYQKGLKLMNKQRWREAEQTFREVISMADVLPQPWNSLGNALLMQRRVDEAREAFQRALELDLDYELAKKNLEVIEHVDEDFQPMLLVNKPFIDAKIDIVSDTD